MRCALKNILKLRNNYLLIYRIRNPLLLQFNRPVIIIAFEAIITTTAHDIIIILSLTTAYDIVIKINIVVTNIIKI